MHSGLGTPSYDIQREFLWKPLPDVGWMEREREVQLQQLDLTLKQPRPTMHCSVCWYPTAGQPSLSLMSTHTQKHTCRHPSGKDVYSRLPWQRRLLPPPALLFVLSDGFNRDVQHSHSRIINWCKCAKTLFIFQSRNLFNNVFYVTVRVHWDTQQPGSFKDPDWL